MSLISLGGAITIPDARKMMTGNFDASNLTIDATGEKAAVWIGRIPKTGVIDRLCFRIDAVTGAQTLRIGLYTVDASGNPTTSNYNGGSPVTLAAGSVTTGWKEVTASYAASADDEVALVVEFDGTIGNVRIAATSAAAVRYPYPSSLTTVWTPLDRGTVAAFRYDDGTYPEIFSFPIASSSSASFNVDTGTADEYASRIYLPFSARCIGIWAALGSLTGTNFEVRLYEGTTLRRTVVIDGDATGQPSSTSRVPHFFYFSGYTLSASTEYWASIRPTTAVSLTLGRVTVNSASLMDALNGAAFYQGTRLDATGSWTTDATIRPFIGVLIDQLDVTPSGVAGGNTYSRSRIVNR